jgi:hypothetical protein
MVAETEVPAGIGLAQLVTASRQGLQRALEAIKRQLGIATQPVHIATSEQRVGPAVAVIELVEQGQGLLKAGAGRLKVVAFDGELAKPAQHVGLATAVTSPFGGRQGHVVGPAPVIQVVADRQEPKQQVG